MSDVCATMARDNRQRVQEPNVKADDREDLDTFLERAARLLRTDLVTSGHVPFTTKLSFRTGEPLRVTNSQPSEDRIFAFVGVLRPLITQGDRASMHRMFNLCERELRSRARREALRDLRRDWRAKQRQGEIRLVVNDADLRPDRLADLLINGWYFHDEPRKRKELQQLVPEFAMFAHHVFYAYVMDCAEVATVVASNIREARTAGELR
jgi:hypothetical protein